MVRNSKAIPDVGTCKGKGAREINVASAENGATIIMTCGSEGRGHRHTHTFIYISSFSHYATYIISFDLHN